MSPLYDGKIYESFVLKRKKKNMNVLIKQELTNLVSIDTLYISITNKGIMYINSALWKEVVSDLKTFFCWRIW